MEEVKKENPEMAAEEEARHIDTTNSHVKDD